MSGIHDFTAKSLAGEDIPLKRFEGQVLLIVNTASACGFTPHTRASRSCIRRLARAAFSVLGFPCNQFGRQEPGDAAQIEQFCTSNYAVTFPMFAKIDVNGSDAHPLVSISEEQEVRPARHVDQMEFHQFLVDRAGKVVARHAPTAKPEGACKRNRGAAVNEEK